MQQANMMHQQQQQQTSHYMQQTSSVIQCAGCEQPIMDQFLYNVLDRAWHQTCIQCWDCKLPLSEKCFSREGKLFCKDDFFRLETIWDDNDESGTHIFWPLSYFILLPNSLGFQTFGIQRCLIYVEVKFGTIMGLEWTYLGL